MNQDERDFWAEVESLIKPIAKVEIEYRLHYDELGEIVMCSMADHPESNHYVVVSKDKYQRYFDYRIVKGQLIKIDQASIVDHVQNFATRSQIGDSLARTAGIREVD